jgi:hypothetical protein
LTNIFFYNVAELSPPPEPYNPEADPTMMEALDMIRIANEVIDEAVDRLLNEAAERRLNLCILESVMLVYSFRLYKNQTLSFCMYFNVIYFFVMHETFVRTVFELLAKKTPSLLFMLHEEKRFSLYYCRRRLTCYGKIYLPKACLVL